MPTARGESGCEGDLCSRLADDRSCSELPEGRVKLLSGDSPMEELP